MSSTKLTIDVQKTGIQLDDQVVFLDEAFVRKEKLPTEQPITLRFGAYKVDIKVSPVKSLKGMRLHASLANRLGIGHGATLCAAYDADARTLAIGPLIGVMMSRVHPHEPEQPFGDMTAFCRELLDACRILGGYAYFFTSDGIRESVETLEGWSFNGKWHRSLFPAPDVVYNRLTSRKYENKPSVQHFMKEVKSRYGANVFNEKYLNKTEVFDALAEGSALRKYLPESHLFRNMATLKAMCAKYPVVFLKPITGSLGKGIVRITREPRQYTCHFAGVNGAVGRSYPNFAKMAEAISGRIKRNRYQIQQGLNLITVGGRPVDFRALVQKNEEGKWKVTSIVGRVAGMHHFVSNLARGGHPISAAKVLARSNLGSSSGLLAQLRKAAVLLAEGVERHIPGHFGELGIDLAVDTDGKMWLLEINSKPSKNFTAPPRSKVRPSVRQLVQYAHYLAKF